MLKWGGDEGDNKFGGPKEKVTQSKISMYLMVWPLPSTKKDFLSLQEKTGIKFSF